MLKKVMLFLLNYSSEKGQKKKERKKERKRGKKRKEEDFEPVNEPTFVITVARIPKLLQPEIFELIITSIISGFVLVSNNFDNST